MRFDTCMVLHIFAMSWCYKPIRPRLGRDGQQTWSHRPMTPLSGALTVRVVAALEPRQIRLAAELGFLDEGGSVEAVIGRLPLALRKRHSSLSQDSIYSPLSKPPCGWFNQ